MEKELATYIVGMHYLEDNIEAIGQKNTQYSKSDSTLHKIYPEGKRVYAYFFPAQTGKIVVDKNAKSAYSRVQLVVGGKVVGTVSYKFSKEQYAAYMDGLREKIDAQLAALVEGSPSDFSAIAHTEDYKHFDVSVPGTSVGLRASMYTLALYTYGGLYGVFSGDRGTVTVDFLDPDGNVLQSASSDGLGGAQ